MGRRVSYWWIPVTEKPRVLLDASPQCDVVFGSLTCLSFNFSTIPLLTFV